MEEQPKVQETGKKPVAMYIAIGIGIVVLGAVSGYYYWTHRTKTADTAATTTNTTATTTPAATTTTTTTSTPASTTATATTTPTPAPTTVTYTNSQYGFSMTLPISWANYKIKSAKYDGEVATLYFEMPTTDSSPASSTNDKGYYSPFALGIYTPAQWDAIVAEGGPAGTVITQNSQYVYTWSHANGIPATDFDKDADIKGIIASFEIQ